MKGRVQFSFNSPKMRLERRGARERKRDKRERLISLGDPTMRVERRGARESIEEKRECRRETRERECIFSDPTRGNTNADAEI